MSGTIEDFPFDLSRLVSQLDMNESDHQQGVIMGSGWLMWSVVKQLVDSQVPKQQQTTEHYKSCLEEIASTAVQDAWEFFLDSEMGVGGMH